MEQQSKYSTQYNLAYEKWTSEQLCDIKNDWNCENNVAENLIILK